MKNLPVWSSKTEPTGKYGTQHMENQVSRDDG
jgi:hypothetical protein